MKRYSWIYLLIFIGLIFTSPTFAEQSQPQQQQAKKNYQALIIKNDYDQCINNLSAVLEQNEQLQAEIIKLKKPQDVSKPEPLKTLQDKPGSEQGEGR